MSAAKRPSWLIDALGDDAGAGHAQATTLTTPAPGQIRRLEPMDRGAAEPRLVVVTHVDYNLAMATVAIVSPEVDMGTDIDRFIAKGTSETGYDLLALPDVSGPAWFVQLGPVIGTVESALNDLPGAGIPLRDDLDARWFWKENELDGLIALTGECRYQLLDGEPATVTDPVALDLTHVGARERDSMALATVKLLRHEQALVPTEALELPPVPYNSTSFESFEAIRLAIGRHRDLVLSPTSEMHREAPHLRQVENDPLPLVLESVVRRLADSTRCIRVATVSSLWDWTNTGEAIPDYSAVTLDGKRHQLVVSMVDAMEVSYA